MRIITPLHFFLPIFTILAPRGRVEEVRERLDPLAEHGPWQAANDNKLRVYTFLVYLPHNEREMLRTATNMGLAAYI